VADVIRGGDEAVYASRSREPSESYDPFFG